MKVVALVSGGKDSCYATMKCIQYGHEIVALANLMPSDDTVDELDSYMYQTVGHQIVIGYAKCMGLPLFRRRIQGSTRYQKLSYKMTPGDEVEDMFILLSEVKKHIPSINAVSSGAIASDYQRLRVESVCSRLGLVSLAYLWKRDQLLLLEEMVNNGVLAILVKVASMGMDPRKHLGKDIAQLKPYLCHLKDMYGINICGEGGEYETLTLDCPLFTNARIVLDEFKVVLHSLDSIASVGILHPVAFHLDIKNSVFCNDKINYNITDDNYFVEKVESVHEVQQNFQQEIFRKCTYVDKTDDLVEFFDFTFFTWRTNWNNTFSMGCWLQNSCRSGFQEELMLLLSKGESKLKEYGFGWEYVLYIHLYIADMDNFALANETYVRFITEDKCQFGVPSRCTVEMPLVQAGFARTYVELLVTNSECRKALHVQSISCWAPSCIGPYSQATLHDNVLHMAGQLGLDPPTMSLRLHGPVAELEQAIRNCEAVAKCFNSSIATETIMFSFYLSAEITSSQKKEIKEKLELLLLQMRTFELNGRTGPEMANPIFLYIVVPGLPKRASVEVKPVLYVEEAPPTDIPTEPTNEVGRACLHAMPGFKQEPWHIPCVQKYVIYGRICAAVLNITNESASKILSEMFAADQNHTDSQYLACKQMEGLTRFCFVLLDMILRESGFTWEDLMVLRIYIPTSWRLSPGTIASFFSKGCELVTGKVNNKGEHIFNLVPVLGCGRSATSTNDVITCELFATKCAAAVTTG